MANSRKPPPQADKPADVLAAALAAALLASDGATIAVAFSGGLDSSVLLHAVFHALGGRPDQVIALHVNHGLSPNANEWEANCARFCVAIGIPFFAQRVVLEKRASIEAAARKARYEALTELCKVHGASVLFTAHHAEDLAETVLLNVLRGTGVKGMRGIADTLDTGLLKIVRPLLGVRRELISAYASDHGLAVVHDESNLDRRFTRNAVRHDALPALLKIAPTAVARLAALARHARSADRLLTDLAQIDLEQGIGPSQGLLTARLRSLSIDRAANLLRYWLASQAAPALSERRLFAWLAQLRGMQESASTSLIVGEHRFSVVMGELSMASRKAPPGDRVDVNWQRQPFVDVPVWGGRLWFDEAAAGGIAEERLLAEVLSLRPRVGGERLQIHPGRPSRTLKNLYHEAEVDVQSRRWLPIVYCGKDLIYAAGIGMNLRACDELALGSSRLSVRWQALQADGMQVAD